MDREILNTLNEVNKNLEKIYRRQGKIEKELQKHCDLLELVEDNSDKILEIQYSLERYTGDIESKISK